MSVLHDRVDRLETVVGRLGNILHAETRALAEHRPADLGAMEEQKIRLTAVYDEEMADLRRDPGLLARAEKSEISRLKGVIGEFRRVLDDHSRALFAAKTVTERLIRAVADEVSKSDRAVTGYAGDAKTAALTRPPGGRPVSLAINEVI